MPQIFNRATNRLPKLTLLGVFVGGGVVTLLIWYYFSPKFTDVGYAPEQPVPYSHQLHVGQLGLNCQYCHSYVQQSSHSNIPATQTCMNCHSQIRTQSLKLLPVRESWATGEPIPWVKVHHLADYAAFSHAVHVNVGVGCETCHGRVDQMVVVEQKQPLSMGWCLDCHRNPEEHLRPPSEVTTMGYQRPANYIEMNLERMRQENIRPPETCGACHY